MKEIPKKNYIVLFIVLIISFVLVYYFYIWYVAYKDNNLKTSIMDKYLQVIHYNELGNYVVENNNVYIYASIIGSEDIRQFEYEFKNEIGKNGLKNKVLYMDLTNEINDGIKLEYSLTADKVPCILVFKDGQLTDTYEIKHSGYSSKKSVAFLVSEDVLEDD